MPKIITFSRTYPSYHPKAGQPTYFVEKILNSIGRVHDWSLASDFLPREYFETLDLYLDEMKHHTIRSGHRFKVGDKFSPRVWSGTPYRSKMIQFAPDIEVKKQSSFDLINNKLIIGGLFHCLVYQEEKIESFAKNDGLSSIDLLDWFKYPKPITENQIICWNDSISYL